MKRKTQKDIILGFFVLTGLLIFFGLIYYMGKQNQIFGADIKITSVFRNVSGLKSGNNVRLSGIKIGIVDHLEIVSDSSVQVTMIIGEDEARFIKKDAMATIESEGLMGNKIVTISGGSTFSPGIEDGDEIESRSPIGIDEAIQTFMTTAEETSLLFTELNQIIINIRKGEGLLGVVVSDSTVKDQFVELVSNINESSSEAVEIVRSLKKTTRALNQGSGLANRVLYDSVWAGNTAQIIDTVAYLSGNLAVASKELQTFSEKLNNRNGLIDKLLTDSVMTKDVEITLQNIRQGSDDIEGALNTIEHSWLLNLFSKNKDKKEKKENKNKKNGVALEESR
jgi:phospholipid/cholesterol/gamma-HCH transport system substrate-binding protein